MDMDTNHWQIFPRVKISEGSSSDRVVSLVVCQLVRNDLPSGDCLRFIRVFDMPNASLQRLQSVRVKAPGYGDSLTHPRKIRTYFKWLKSNSHPGYPGDCAIHHDEEAQCTVVGECDTA